MVGPARASGGNLGCRGDGGGQPPPISPCTLTSKPLPPNAGRTYDRARRNKVPLSSPSGAHTTQRSKTRSMATSQCGTIGVTLSCVRVYVTLCYATYNANDWYVASNTRNIHAQLWSVQHWAWRNFRVQGWRWRSGKATITICMSVSMSICLPAWKNLSSWNFILEVLLNMSRTSTFP
jgi:hypothetical protein